MTEEEFALAAHFLGEAAAEFGNHGCNDFDLKAHVPDLEERLELVQAMHEWNGDPEEYDPDNVDIVADFFLMGYLADQLRNML